MSIMTPSVQAMSVNECPLPTARTRSPLFAACAITSASSASEVGRTIADGAQTCSPGQLLHIGLIGPAP